MRNISQRTKQAIAIAVVAIFVGGVILTAGLATYVPRGQTLRILGLPGDIMPQSVVKDFEKQIRKQSSGKFRVKYEVAESNDMIYDILTNEKKKEKDRDYDLVIVSERMAEKMFVNELLLPMELATTVRDRYAAEVINPLNAVFAEHSDDAKDKIFAVPYLYGTLGIMANPKKLVHSNAAGTTSGTTGDVIITPEQLDEVRASMKSWAALWDTKYTGKISMKNVARDSYTAALLYHFKDEMNSELLKRITGKAPGAGAGTNRFLNVMDDALKSQAALLSKQYGYEVSAGKDSMADVRLNHLPAIGMYWSSDAGLVMPKNKNLEFYVPDEGSALWVDSLVMSRYAKNKSVALKFLDFISNKNNAIRIMKHTNTACAVTEARIQYSNDLKTQYAEEEEWVDRYLTALLPDGGVGAQNSVLDRCRLLRYLGEASDTQIGKVWDAVKK